MFVFFLTDYKLRRMTTRENFLQKLHVTCHVLCHPHLLSLILEARQKPASLSNGWLATSINFVLLSRPVVCGQGFFSDCFTHHWFHSVVSKKKLIHLVILFLWLRRPLHVTVNKENFLPATTTCSNIGTQNKRDFLCKEIFSK